MNRLLVIIAVALFGSCSTSPSVKPAVVNNQATATALASYLSPEKFDPSTYPEPVEMMTWMPEHYKHSVISGLRLTYYLDTYDFNKAIGLIDYLYEKSLTDLAYQDKLFLELYSVDNLQRKLNLQMTQFESHFADDPKGALILGVYYRYRAMFARGSGPAKNLSENTRLEMKDWYDKAAQQLNIALAQQKNPYVVHVLLGDVYQQYASQTELKQTHYMKAIELKPESYWVWAQVMKSLTPGWGGSYEAMEQAISYARNFYGQNPGLRVIEANIKLDIAARLRAQQKYQEIVELLEPTLAFGEYHRTYSAIAWPLFRTGRQTEACQLMKRAYELRPYTKSFNNFLAQYCTQYLEQRDV